MTRILRRFTAAVSSRTAVLDACQKPASDTARLLEPTRAAPAPTVVRRGESAPFSLTVSRD